MADINVTEEIIDINVTEEVITIEAPTGAYPFPNAVFSVFGRVGAIVAAEGDYNLTQLGDVTLTSPANGQVLKYNGTQWVNSTDADTGITTLNTLTALSQSFATGTSGTDFNISSATSTHTFNLPTASDTNRGLLSSADWTTFNNKQNALTNPITGTGTSGQVAFWNGTNTQTGNNNLFWDATNDRLGIGINSPLYTFHIRTSTGGTNPWFTPMAVMQGSGATFYLQNTAAGGGFGSFGVGATSGNFILSHDATKNFVIQSTDGVTFNNRFNIVGSSGNVGINTSTDAGFRLDVNGTARIQGFTTINAAPAVNGSAALLVQPTTNNSVSALLYGIDNNSIITTINSSSSYIGINSRNAIGASLVQATSVQGALNISAGTTTAAIGYSVNSAVIGTGAATLFIGYNFENVFTSGSGVVTRQFGIRIGNLTEGGTANVGLLFNNAANTSVSGTWDIYAQSGNRSYFEGDFAIGTTTLGTATKFTLGGSETASSAIARGGLINTTLVAAANNDVLVGLDINPTFTNGAFTGLQNWGIRLFNSIRFQTDSDSGQGLYWKPANDGTTLRIYGSTYSGNVGYLQLNVQSGSDGLVVNGGARTLTISAAQTSIALSLNNIIFNTHGTGEAARIVNSSKNFLINTTTDGGFRLDVNGTARVQSTLISGGGTPLVLTGESFALQAISAGLPSGAVFGTNVANNPSFINILSGNNFWHFTNRSSTNANRLGIYNASFTGTTATYSSELLTISTTGSVGIASTSLTNYTLRASKNITGSTTSYGIAQTGAVQSDVTSVLYSFYSQTNTAATSFTLGTYVHYMSDAATLGAGSSITSQVGFLAQSSLTNATNNYGFYGNIGAATNRWNLYMGGTAANYMAGVLNIGTTTLSGFSLDVNGTTRIQDNITISKNANAQTRLDINNTTSGALSVSGIQITSDATSGQFSVVKYSTATTSYKTLASRDAIIFNNSTAGNISILNDFATGNINFATGGVSTAQATLFSTGNFAIGTGTDVASAVLQASSTTKGFLPPRMTTVQKLAIGTPAAGLMVYDTTLNQMSYYNGTLWINF